MIRERVPAFLLLLELLLRRRYPAVESLLVGIVGYMK